MNPTQATELALTELQVGMELTKCQQCGCMRETLETLRSTLSADADTRELAKQAATWLGHVAPIRYACLGCAHCYPAVALNALADAHVVEEAGLACAFEATDRRWPVVAGEYVTFCDSVDCSVAVSTLASTQLVDTLARRRPAGLCIVGKTETDNNQLQHVIEGTTSGSLYSTIIDAGWVSQLSHAAYLGRELGRAELSGQHGIRYVQDGA